MPTATLVSDSNFGGDACAKTLEKAKHMIENYQFYEAWGDNVYIYRLDLAACHKLPKYLFEPIEVPDV